ncbi:unnamed protein product [Rangifer tarandus platyrhynchus]|uniref:Uncharacterized protein n=2 Tax=Rangifer tarandus platyrhynchus TaxID=3082113 RepID=A0ABN8ZKB7_RANTA|nr:unnamed protein product [Rangifer tarandus platyrhynchus]
MSAFTEKITTQRKNRDAGRGSWSPPCLSLSSLFFPPVSLQMNRFHICDSWDPVSVVLVQENRIEKPNMMSLELLFHPYISQSRKLVLLSPLVCREPAHEIPPMTRS